MYSFGPSVGKHIDRFGSDFLLSPLTDPDGVARVACFHLSAGSVVGEHEAITGQMFCVMDGEGWVAGSEGKRLSIGRHEAAYWAPGEVHSAGTESGLTAIVMEGNDFRVWAKPPDPGA